MATKPTNQTEPIVGLTPEQVQAMIAEAVAKGKQEAIDEIDAKRAAAEKASEERALQGDKLLEREESSTLQKLKAQKHRKIFIPLSEIGDNSPVPVGINGVIYTIPKGIEFDVPEDIYTQWKNSYDKTMAANAKLVVKRIGEEEIRITD